MFQGTICLSSRDWWLLRICSNNRQGWDLANPKEVNKFPTWVGGSLQTPVLRGGDHHVVDAAAQNLNIRGVFFLRLLER